MLNSNIVIGLLIKMSLAFPFWIVWTICGIGEKFFYFLPPIYKNPGFWDCVGVFIVLPILKNVFLPNLAVTNKQIVEKQKDSEHEELQQNGSR